MNEHKTTQDFVNESMTVRELVRRLKTLPQDFKVYLASDSEGNSYSTLDSSKENWSIGGITLDRVIILQPFADHLQFENIAPKQDAVYELEMQEKMGVKKVDGKYKFEETLEN